MTESNRSRTDAETHAEDRLVDAMLRGLHHDTPDSIRGRLERVRTAIESDAGADEHPTALPIGRAIRWQRYVQAVVGGAGALAAVLFLAVLLQPAPVGATDLLNLAREAEARAANGDQRYKVSIHPPHGVVDRPVLEGVLDVRDGKLIRFELTRPDGRRHIWGLGRNGPWESGPKSTVSQVQGRRWPGWLESSSESLLIDTMPALLDLVVAGYEASTTEGEDDGRRIVARQIDPLRGGPDEVVIDLDAGHQQVRALELRWNPGSDARWRRLHGMEKFASPENGRGRRGAGTNRSKDGHWGGDARRPDPTGPSQRGWRGQRGSNAESSASGQSHGLEHRRERWERPRRGGFRHGHPPQAPSRIRFERLPAGPVSEDWFDGPVQDSQSDPKE